MPDAVAGSSPDRGPTAAAPPADDDPGAQAAVGDAAAPLPAFAHASEAELARILDFYAVRWEYEPHTFPILWSLDGAVVESFAPDFFLPDLDLYVELTTLKQKLVRRKNRKLRRLRELYPDIRIKLFYARDFKMLMLKFGRVGLFDELSGTTGQVVPLRLDPDETRVPEAVVVAPPQPVATTATDGALSGSRSRNRRRRRSRAGSGRTVPARAATDVGG